MSPETEGMVPINIPEGILPGTHQLSSPNNGCARLMISSPVNIKGYETLEAPMIIFPSEIASKTLTHLVAILVYDALIE